MFQDEDFTQIEISLRMAMVCAFRRIYELYFKPLMQDKEYRRRANEYFVREITRINAMVVSSKGIQ